MRFIFAALCLYLFEWVGAFAGDFKWDFLLGCQLLSVALLVSGVFVLCSLKTLLLRSVLCLWAIAAWVDILKFGLWSISGRSIEASIPIAIIFSLWLTLVLGRRYDRKNDTIKAGNVTILIKRPKGILDVFKSLFGAPAPSICLSVNGRVWSYRKRTSQFETFPLNTVFLASHIAVDTGAVATPELLAQLNSKLGEPRGNACKCIWTIQDPLNMLGGKFRIKTWFDYVPSFYIMRIL